MLFVQHIINHSPSTVTGYPPSVAVFGRRVLASELLANVAVDRENDVPVHPAEIRQLNYDEAYPYIAELDNRLARIRERSNVHLDKALHLVLIKKERDKRRSTWGEERRNFLF